MTDFPIVFSAPMKLYRLARYDQEHVSVSFQGACPGVSATLSVPIDMARSLELFGTYEIVLRSAQGQGSGDA